MSANKSNSNHTVSITIAEDHEQKYNDSMFDKHGHAKPDEHESADTILVDDVPSHKAVPNKWRAACKQHFEEFWQSYMDVLVEDNERYHRKFIELHIDDIRCIPYLTHKHLSMHVHMLESDANLAMRRIHKFNQYRDMFFAWVLDTCRREDYVANFESGGILTWKIFSQRIVKKSDIYEFIPEDQLSKNIDRNLFWARIPKDLWAVYRVDPQSVLDERNEKSFLSAISSSRSSPALPSNLRPEISWNQRAIPPHAAVEYVWMLLALLLLLFDILVALTIFLSDVSVSPLDGIMPYLENNVLNEMHFMLQLLLALSWLQWVVFVEEMNPKFLKCVQYAIVTCCGLCFVLLVFNVVHYVLFTLLAVSVDDHAYLTSVHDIQTNKFHRNTWFVLQSLAFVLNGSLIGVFSVYRMKTHEFKYLALRSQGESKLVEHYNEHRNDCCCTWFAYFSLSVTRYLICSLLLNALLFTQTAVWLFARYVSAAKLSHRQIRNSRSFQTLIFATDLCAVSLAVLLVYYLRKQRRNYLEIEEMNHSKRKLKIGTHCVEHTADLHNLDGFSTNLGTPVL